MVEWSRKLNQNSQEILQKTMPRNGFFAHSEAVLLAMLADSEKEIWDQAVNTILAIRSGASSQSQPATCSNDDDDDDGSDEEDEEDEVEEAEEDDAFTFEASERKAILTSTVRKYVVPKINFKATSYTELIDLNKAGLTEPPLTLSLSDSQIISFKDTPFEVPNYPCILKRSKELFVSYQKPPPKLLVKKQGMVILGK